MFMRRPRRAAATLRHLAPCDGCPTSEAGRSAEALARRLRDTIEVLVRRFSIAERADVACCGMTVAQAATLEALRRDGPQRLGDLGRRLGIAPSTLTRNLARLEERRLVLRDGDPQDSRAFRASLTPRGREAADEVERQEVGFARAVLARLEPAERPATVSAVEALVAVVLDATEACCPGAFSHLAPRDAASPTRKGRTRP